MRRIALITTFYLLLFTLSKAADYSPRAEGAKGDGIAKDHKAINRAIQKAFAAGGGRVVVEPGRYRCGTVTLLSNVELHLQAGATIIGSDTITDYDFISWGGDKNRDRQPFHLIYAGGASNIAITGQGTIDGNGKAFWATGQQLFTLPPDSIPTRPEWILAKSEKVSPMVEISGCRNVRIEGITLTNPAGWTLHLFNVKQGGIRGIHVNNNLFAPNADGIDLTGCEDITISDCRINTCDDAICLKTSPDGMNTRRITITNCVIKTMCVALKLGNESWGDMSQITFSNCVVHQSSRVIGIYARDGGVLEDMIFSNIVADTRAPFIFNRPIHISLLQTDPKKKGAIRNVLIDNFICRTDGRILITAPPGDTIENLTLRNIHLIYPRIEDPRPMVPGSRSNQFSPGNNEARAALAALVIDGVKGLQLDNIKITWPTGPIPTDWRFPERIEHGGNRRFTPDYNKTNEVELSVLWLKRCSQIQTRAIASNPSAKSAKAILATGKWVKTDNGLEMAVAK